MLGALIITFVLVVVLPVAFLMGGAVLAALFGWTLYTEGRTGANEEYVELNY